MPDPKSSPLLSQPPIAPSAVTVVANVNIANRLIRRVAPGTARDARSSGSMLAQNGHVASAVATCRAHDGTRNENRHGLDLLVVHDARVDRQTVERCCAAVVFGFPAIGRRATVSSLNLAVVVTLPSLPPVVGPELLLLLHAATAPTAVSVVANVNIAARLMRRVAAEWRARRDCPEARSHKTDMRIRSLQCDVHTKDKERGRACGKTIA